MNAAAADSFVKVCCAFVWAESWKSSWSGYRCLTYWSTTCFLATCLDMPPWKRGKHALHCFWMQFLKTLVVFSLCGTISADYNAHKLMSSYPLIDGHNDLALQLRIRHSNRLKKTDLHNLSELATDISRLQAGHVQTQMFAVYVPCRAQDKDAVRLTLEQIDVVRRMCTKYQEFELVTSVQELKRSKDRGKIACLISIEGGHSIDSSLPALRMFYQLGVRSMSLTHSCNTPWAESSSDFYDVFRRQNNSLTDFGMAVVKEMNRLGMIVDLSHTSWNTTLTVLKHSMAPVIFSHSSSYSICNHSRNVPDSLLRELKKNQGLIMVNLHSQFISCRGVASISHVADHFDHIRKVIGAQSIGIGGDYEGATSFPQGLEDVSKYPALIQELINRNWTKEELAGILRKNFLRVFEEVERVRDNSSSLPPSEDQIPLEEVQKQCRLDLKHPILMHSSRSSRPERGLPDLLILATVLMLSTLFLIE